MGLQSDATVERMELNITCSLQLDGPNSNCYIPIRLNLILLCGLKVSKVALGVLYAVSILHFYEISVYVFPAHLWEMLKKVWLQKRIY